MIRSKRGRLWIGATGALAALFAAGVFLPATRMAEAEATIGAWPATVFALVADARRAAQWSPWAEGAADARFTGPPAGVGATFTWTGEQPGRWRVVQAEPASRLEAALELDGAPGTSHVELVPVEGGTRVRWRVELDLGYDLAARWAAIFSLDSLDERLDAGLAALATLAETLPRADFGGLAVEQLTVESMPVAWRRVRTRPDPAAVSRALGDAFFEILAFMRRHGLTETGPPLAASRAFEGPELALDAGIPVGNVTAATPRAEGNIRLGESHAGPAIRVTHRGSYATLVETHRRIAAWLAAYGVARAGDAWEVYVSDPARTPEAERVTLIYYPVEPRAAARE
jgi:effector-binding domain-containing protein/uncharacterized protein YndB with AHSA1/START domain